MIARDHLVRLALAATVIGLGLWIASCTEWVEKEIPTPARGEALTNPLYAAQHLARALGATVEQPTGLSRLPPPGSTLWLTSSHGDLFPDTSKRLRAWVEGGGHLVVQASMLGNDALAGWVPVREAGSDDEEKEEAGGTGEGDEAARSAKAERAVAKALARIGKGGCRTVAEPATVARAVIDPKPYRLCGETEGHLVTTSATAPPLWAAGGPANADFLRVARGRGSVTVMVPRGLFTNERLFDGDHPALLVAAMQIRRGAVLWFVTEEARVPLLKWLWQEAHVVLLLGGLALALALWRGAVRFGPLVPVDAPVRRSMAEQVTGTAQFLRLRGAGALHGAQVRALDETAAAHLPKYLALNRGERAALLARATGLDAQALASALDRALRRPPHALAAALELIETARRRVPQAGRGRHPPALPASASSAPPPHSPTSPHSSPSP